ncbi:MULTISPECIES: ATP-binding protein [Microtetraspora]|uniref:ATP-binding protein n=1 Tax=Microtetraspora glauca TaxID=1996 RepID=A0ABV3GJZ3_MICGL|nr:ATP-binding protein [Microtetraspora sp. AC03309]
MSGTLLSLEFDRSAITLVRHMVTESARNAGLVGMALEDFVLAVHEAVTNAVRYGIAPRGIAMWREPGLLRCEVTDSGPGIPDRTLHRKRMARFDFGGRGIWLMHRLADVTIRTGPDGTTVLLSAAIP